MTTEIKIIKRKKKKFVRGNFWQYSKLGLRRKKKIKYRKGDGIDNKMRLKIKGHLKNVEIGYRSKKSTRDLIEGKKPVVIYNIAELLKVNKDEIVIIGKIGDKKRKEILEYAKDKKIRIHNLNPEKKLVKIEEKVKQSKERKLNKINKAKKEEKKAKTEVKNETDKDNKAEVKKETEIVSKTESKKETEKSTKDENSPTTKKSKSGGKK